MGSGSWSSSSYSDYATRTSYATKSTREVFSNSNVPDSLRVNKITLRESCDSEDNPNSTPVILALDVTGSMGEYAAKIAKESLPELMGDIYEKRPITNPHLMFMGIDDIHTYRKDSSLQVSQFEADIRILEQLRDIYLVGGGGGNNSESYDLAWYFAAHKTAIDSFNKRGQRGFLFTFGDEEAPYETITEADLVALFGTGQYASVTPQESLAAAREKYNVFHVVIEQGDYYRTRPSRVRESWTEIMGNNVLFLRDFRDLSEVVTATMRIANGESMETVISESKKPEALRHAFANSLAE